MQGKKMDTNNLIISLWHKFNFYKPPKRIGEIIEYENVEFLIIGIEKVKFTGRKLGVLYTCQKLNCLHTVQPIVKGMDGNLTDFFINIDTVKHFSESEWLLSSRTDNILPIGEVFKHENHYFRWVNYTDLEFEFTTLKVSGSSGFGQRST